MTALTVTTKRNRLLARLDELKQEAKPLFLESDLALVDELISKSNNEEELTQVGILVSDSIKLAKRSLNLN